MLPAHSPSQSPAFDGAAFRRNIQEDFRGELDALIRAGLLDDADDGGRYRFSERGIFSCCRRRLLAWMRVNELSVQSNTAEVWKDESAMERMG